jgi:hypothetical protein
LKAELRRETLRFLTFIQALIRELDQDDWTYAIQKNAENHITHLFFVSRYAMRWRTINHIIYWIVSCKRFFKSCWKLIMKFSSWIVFVKLIVINFHFSSSTNKRHCTTIFMLLFASWRTKSSSTMFECCSNYEHYMLN